MISIPLFMHTMRKNWVLLVIFMFVLSMYMTIMLAMYDVDNMESILAMLDLFPEDMMRAMGFSQIVTDLTSYLASWLYGLLMFGFPMVYCIILSNRLVAKMVDNNAFVYFLATPNSRVKIVFTQGLYALLSVIVMFSLLFLIGAGFSAIIHPEQLDINAFFKLNLTTMLVNCVVMMIGFFFSCLMNESRRAITFGAGLPIAFLLMNMLGGISDEGRLLKSMSIFGFYDPVDLVRNQTIWHINLIYLAITIILFISAMMVFDRKQLTI